MANKHNTILYSINIIDIDKIKSLLIYNFYFDLGTLQRYFAQKNSLDKYLHI